MTKSTASAYRERGRVWVRMELSEAEFADLVQSMLGTRGPIHWLLTKAMHEKVDRGDIFDRFDDPDTEIRRDSAR